MNVIRSFPLYAKLNLVRSQILHVHSIWNLFKFFTVSLSAEEFANRTFNLSYPNFRRCRSNRSASHEILIYSPTISTSQYVGDTCQANEKGQGHVRPKSSGEQFLLCDYKYPSPFLTSFTPLDLSPARASQTLAPPLLHRRRWGRASLPRTRRPRTRANRRYLHSVVAVAVSRRQVRVWEIWTDELLQLHS